MAVFGFLGALLLAVMAAVIGVVGHFWYVVFGTGTVVWMAAAVAEVRSYRALTRGRHRIGSAHSIA